jgi:alpha-1,6-mannosyltransferase
MLVVTVFHLGLLSVLGHKETRFISYLVPLLNTFASKATISVLYQRSLLRRRMGQILVLMTMSCTFLVTIVSLRASAGNYPGGEAMRALHSNVRSQNSESCHQDLTRDI